MIRFLLATGLILALLLGWLLVQQLSRQFSKRHPELGPHREEGGGCAGMGGSCSCSGSQQRRCKKEG
jgi:hypothetical protein